MSIVGRLSYRWVTETEGPWLGWSNFVNWGSWIVRKEVDWRGLLAPWNKASVLLAKASGSWMSRTRRWSQKVWGIWWKNKPRKTKFGFVLLREQVQHGVHPDGGRNVTGWLVLQASGKDWGCKGWWCSLWCLDKGPLQGLGSGASAGWRHGWGGLRLPSKTFFLFFIFLIFFTSFFYLIIL